MPEHDLILNLPGLSIIKIEGYDPLIYHVKHLHRSLCCPHCGSKHLRKKDLFTRIFEHERIGLRRVCLSIESHKFLCRSCGRYFRERFEGILPYQRATEPCRRQVFHLHRHGITRKQLGHDFAKSDGTITRWYEHMFDLEHRKRLSMRCPTIMGIDEHYFSKKRRTYATTLCDLKKQRIFDVVEGKSEHDLKCYLETLEGREQVRVVCMDLSSGYRYLIRKYFPNAKIVSDRFHVVRIIQHHLIQTAIQLDPSLKETRRVIQLLRMHRSNLTEEQQKKLDHYLNQSPAVKAVYEHKEQWMQLILQKNKTKKHARPLVNQFFQLLQQLKELPVHNAQTLAKTLDSWKKEIARMWRFSKSNGITEGFHRKMKLIQRNAYGFRNFENYRLRVKVLCC